MYGIFPYRSVADGGTLAITVIVGYVWLYRKKIPTKEPEPRAKRTPNKKPDDDYTILGR